MKCNRCGRSLKYPAPSGYGPKCEAAVLGAKPARIRLFDRRVKRSADERQIEIAFEVRS